MMMVRKMRRALALFIIGCCVSLVNAAPLEKINLISRVEAPKAAILVDGLNDRS